ncbi:MAG: tRNA (adenosine(37)-N6)-dimethylallyltransferase MiaA [Planctomycetota bacterium]|nr:MAG: tRNA (adenosine(37)-N6)-dimethylallyltransferase MiaA [Planctomycetota bacterium]
MPKTESIKITAILGPTASGKGKVSLYIAEKIGGEIISCDSMKVYLGMDIGTAKATPEARAKVPHYCMDMVRPHEPFSTDTWLKHAENAIRDIDSCGRKPILSGGTALYLKALREGLFEGPSADLELREELKAEAKEKGNVFLHDRLKKIDPESAERIEINDIRRIVRAIEVYELTGKPISEHQKEWGKPRPEFDIKLYGIRWPRDILRERIAERVDRMYEAGLVEEVRRIHEAAGFGRESSQALGYKEIVDFLEGRCSEDEARENLITRTRQFAKRQMTWFRKMDIEWFDVTPDETAETLAGRILKKILDK